MDEDLLTAELKSTVKIYGFGWLAMGIENQGRLRWEIFRTGEVMIRVKIYPKFIAVYLSSQHAI